MSAFADVLGCGQVKLVMFDSRVTAVSVLPPGVRAGSPPPPGRSLFWNSRLPVLEVLYAEHSPDPPMWAETSSQHCSHDREKTVEVYHYGQRERQKTSCRTSSLKSSFPRSSPCAHHDPCSLAIPGILVQKLKAPGLRILASETFQLRWP